MREQSSLRITIVGSGFYVPEKILTNADLEKMVDTTDEWITTRTGIKERRISAPGELTSDMCMEAAERALKDAGRGVADIDVMIVSTSTPDTIFPSTACWTQSKLKADHIPAFDISAGCTGFLYGLILSEALIFSGTARRVLLIGGETLTKITNWKDRGTCVLFGDGAGAAVLEESQDESGMLSHYWKADGELAELLLQPGGGLREPPSHKMVDLDKQYLAMKGNEVFKHAVKRMGEAATKALKKAGLEKSQVDYLIPHQANVRIIDATGKRLKLPPEKVYVNINRYGNMSVATIPVAVHELRRDGKLPPGTHVVMAAFGAGFTWAAVTYRW